MTTGPSILVGHGAFVPFGIGTDSTVVFPHRWASSNHHDSAHMTHGVIKGLLMGFLTVGITYRYRPQTEG
jgi:hypothetical protein